MADSTPLSPAAQRLRRPWPDVEACLLPDLPDPHLPGLGGRPARVTRTPGRIRLVASPPFVPPVGWYTP